MRKRFLALGCIAAFAVGGNAALAASKTYSLGQWGGVRMELPDGWESELAEFEGMRAFRITPPGDRQFVMLVNPFPSNGMNDDPMTTVKGIVDEVVLPKLRESAVEKNFPVARRDGPECTLLHASATDRTVTQPTAQEFKYTTQGAGALKPIIVVFTLLYNEKDPPERAMALDALASARYVNPGPPWRMPDGTFAMGFPGKKWGFSVKLPGFDVGPVELTRGGIRVLGQKPAAGQVVSVFLEESRPGGTAVSHRDELERSLQSGWRREGITVADVKKSEQGDRAILEYTITAGGGRTVNQRHVNTILVKDGLWVDVHLSKGNYTAGDAAAMNAILETIRFVD